MAETEKKKNSFRDMILIIFVVLVCFGLTIYGIVYLTGKVFSGEEKIEIAKIKTPSVTTDPEDGDILTFSSKPEKTYTKNETEAETSLVEPERADEEKPEKPAPVKTQQYAVSKPEETKPVPRQKPEPAKAAPKQDKAKLEHEPAKKTAAPAKGAYVVQIMAVSSVKDAEKEAARFKNACPGIFVQKADLGAKGIWYRVRCGATDSREQAERIRSSIASKYRGVNPQVVSNR